MAADLLWLTNEGGQPVLAPLVQATLVIGDDGSLHWLEEQPLPDLAGAYWGDPATSSLKHDTQLAFVKPSTDVVLIGHAVAPSSGTRESQVGIRVGPVQKTAKVCGDRKWLKGLGAPSIGRPEPFDRIPLVYERAFGGWDRRHEDPDKHACEPRNPVGVGHVVDKSLAPADDAMLPNIEDPAVPYRRYGDRPPPAGFGFIAAHWQPRSAFAGTYDAAWDKSRKPLLPQDFDRRFFNAASPGLIAPEYLKGDEPVVVMGVTRAGRLDFKLPAIAPPTCVVHFHAGKQRALQSVLDTVIVDMDALTLTLMWRCHAVTRHGPHDVATVAVMPSATP